MTTNFVATLQAWYERRTRRDYSLVRCPLCPDAKTYWQQNWTLLRHREHCFRCATEIQVVPFAEWHGRLVVYCDACHRDSVCSADYMAVSAVQECIQAGTKTPCLFCSRQALPVGLTNERGALAINTRKKIEE